MDSKKWYLSKTEIANVLALLAVIVQKATGAEWFDAVTQLGILALINMGLRAITKQPLGK